MSNDPDHACFSVADVALILDEPERRIRDLHDRGFAGFFGRRDGYRILYSARDIAGAAAARDLVALGFPPRLAARIGATVTYRNPSPDAELAGSPDELAMIAPPAESGIPMDRASYRVPQQTATKISVPIGRIFADVVERASRIQRNA